MNTPSPVPAPAPVAAATSAKSKFPLQSEKQHNRDVSHFLKSAPQHRPMATRSLPHSRGR